MRKNYFTAKLGDEDLGTFDALTLTLTDAFVLERSTGMSINEMLNDVEAVKAAGTRALVWFLRYKQGRPVDLGGIDFVLADLVLEMVPDPTVAKSSRTKARTARSGTPT